MRPNPVSAFASADNVVEFSRRPKKESHSAKMQNTLKLVFAETVARGEFSKNVKDAFLALEKIKLIPQKAARRAALKEFYASFQDHKATLAGLLEIDAKQQDLLRRARKAAANDVMIAFKKQPDCDQSFSLAAELKKCADAAVMPHELEMYLRKHFCANISLTGHPTNPTSLAYTKLGYQFDEFFDSDLANKKVGNFENLLAEILRTPMSGAKKTPMEEAEEIEIALARIKKVEPQLRRELQAIIDSSPLYAGKINIMDEQKFPLVKSCVWTHGGDADGNDNMTAAVIAQGYERLKISGFNEVKVDIRHDSEDLMNAAADVLEKFGIKDFKSKNPQEQEAILTDLLRNPQAVAALQNMVQKLYPIDPQNLQKTGNKNQEIVKRLQVCAAHEGMTDKLIIANTKGANNALAALFLLKVTGNKVAEKGAAINIVTLSETVEDLKEMPQVQEGLLANEIYRQHLASLGKIIVMVAKSDTTRVGGPLAFSYQDQAAGEAFLLAKKAQEKYGLTLDVEVFNGGGAALPRGGGRVGEVANRQSRAAIWAAAKELAQSLGVEVTDAHIKAVIASGKVIMNPPHLTVQGAQNQSLFGGGSARIFLEELMTQSLHAGLRVKGRLLDDKLPQAKAELIREEFCDVGIAAYQQNYFENPVLNELLSKSNRAGVGTGNLSSRPAKRGAGVANPEAGKTTFNQLVGNEAGKVPNAFGMRAITFDRTSAHFGVVIAMVAGLREAFAKYPAQTMSDVDDVSKLFRDFMRNETIQLFNSNPVHSWEIAVRQPLDDLREDVRPNPEVIKAMAKLFSGKTKEELAALPEAERVKLAMAFLDDYVNDVAKEIYTVLTKQKAPDNLNLESLLFIYNKDLAVQMEARKIEAEFATLVEERTTNYFNHHPETVLDAHDLLIIQHSYIAANSAVNSPVSMGLTLTSRKKGAEETYEETSFVSKVDEGKLPLPACIKPYEALPELPVYSQSRL